ncbi:MAG: acyl-CoA dehydrogenase [Desulfobacteraceae bacterium]|nr:MAG: acyl-CoA dehydrogenase [Desulfobacteraceae bacterium]
MVFQITQSQKDIQKAAREFARRAFNKDLVLEMEKNGSLPEKIRRKAAELGFIGIHWPEAYAGAGLGMLENVLVAEAFCEQEASIGIALMFSGFGSECVLHFGSHELRSALLPNIAKGEMLSGAAFMEYGPGYDLAGIETAALKDCDHWVIHGRKAEVLNGGAAGFYCVLCRMKLPSDSPEIGMLLVEADRDGLLVENRRNRLGFRLVRTTDLRFEGVRVPAANLLGKPGRGLQQAAASSMENRILVAALALGTARGAYARAMAYTRQREQFGRKIGQYQVTQHKLAEMALMIEQAGLITYSAAWHFDRGKSDAALVAMAKLASGRAALEVSNEAIQILGGYGYMAEYEVERYCREAKMLEVLEGNSALMKDLIAAKCMGKIR